MTYFMMGAAVVASVGTSLYSAQSAKSSAIKSANSASKAEGEAIAKERLNKTISNSYSTAFAQMQLGLQKRQLSDQKAQVSAAKLAAQGEVATANAATASIGATTQAVVADINQKADAASASMDQAFENAIVNYNNELDMMVLNTDQSAPNIRPNVYTGPSTGEMITGSVLSGLSQFASSYAMRKMSLGAGTNVPGQVKGP